MRLNIFNPKNTQTADDEALFTKAWGKHLDPYSAEDEENLTENLEENDHSDGDEGEDECNSQCGESDEESKPILKPNIQLARTKRKVKEPNMKRESPAHIINFKLNGAIKRKYTKEESYTPDVASMLRKYTKKDSYTPDVATMLREIQWHHARRDMDELYYSLQLEKYGRK